MPKKIIAIIFEGGHPDHWVTEALAAVRAAVALDTIAKIRQVPLIDSIVLATNYADLAGRARAVGVTVHEQSGSFHFGRELQEIIRRTEADGVLCLGGAAAPYLTITEFQAIAASLESEDNIVLTNNPQSADLIAFTPATAVLRVEPPTADNALATVLRDQAGLKRELLPHSLGVHFDLDTPTDVLLMALSEHNGPMVQGALAKLQWPTARLRAALQRLSQRHCEMGLIGRISPQVMVQINSRTFARLRVFSEERGMKALGRSESGQVVSLLGHFIEAVGVENFFSYLSKTCDVCFFDTRVLFAHRQLRLSESERFLSDLGLYQEITHPWLKDFTRAAVDCAIPVILGGHSLVSGGLWAVLDLLGTQREQTKIL
ncbi:MAG: hypothetical protein DDT34_02261 [Firmicutes bacterium]|nr:hypothetical protein [Bacillota bacterium]